jgi:hypothetical protein
MVFQIRHIQFDFPAGNDHRTQTRTFSIGPARNAFCCISGFEFAYVGGGKPVNLQKVNARISRMAGRTIKVSVDVALLVSTNFPLADPYSARVDVILWVENFD